MLKRFWQWLIRSLFVLGALLCFVLTISLTMTEHVPAATLMAGLFVVLVLFHFLPQMESFKAYGVEAKWRERINEADEIVRKLKLASNVFAKLTYHTIGWGSRMADPVRLKQDLADQVDKLLTELGTPAAEITALKQSYLRFARLDLFGIFANIVSRNMTQTQRRVRAQLNAIQFAENEEGNALRRQAEQLEEIIRLGDYARYTDEDISIAASCAPPARTKILGRR
jgi:hypothetical protein